MSDTTTTTPVEYVPTEADRIRALVEWKRSYDGLDAEAVATLTDEAEASTYRADEIDCDGEEWRVMLDDEADAAAEEDVKDHAWAFNAEFLESQTDIPAEMFTFYQEAKSEDANDAFVKIIERTCGMDEFTTEAISTDGRGHFLSGYDGEEQETTITCDDGAERMFYLYRTN